MRSGGTGSAALAADVSARRFAAQLLAGEPARSAEAVVQRLLAVQGQDPRGVRLAIRPRSSGQTAADVDRALTLDRSLVITWLNRGTLHLVAAEDFFWLHDLTAPRMAAGIERRLAQEGVTPAEADRAVTVIARALADAPLTRAGLAERIAATGVETRGQAIVYLLALASLRGLIVRGPVVSLEQAFVLVRDWLGERPRGCPEGVVALAELARRYLAGHGPASDRDLARWSGLSLGQARRGLAALGGELADRLDGLAELAKPSSPAELAGPGSVSGLAMPPPRLLGAFDPVLFGWESREPILGGHQGIITVNGIFRPFALVEGRAAATWTLTGGRVKTTPLREIASRQERALAEDAGDVLRFLAPGGQGR